MDNDNARQNKNESIEGLDFDELEKQLQDQLEGELSDLSFMQEQSSQIGNPKALGGMILDTVWEQFTNQIAIQAGEDFIKANNGLNLDLRSEAHVQTTENFVKGKIATHNTEIDYQKRYDDWQANFKKDENGNVIKHNNRAGREVETLVPGARNPYDKNRPKGNKENGTDMDETVSAAEIIRDPEANAYMTLEERVAFDNSDANLNEMNASLNRSKGDTPTNEWLDNPNSKGQKPDEIFDLTEADKEQLRQKDAEARAEYEKLKKEAEKHSIEAGKKSQKAEAFRVSKKAARAVIMNLLADLVKKIVQKLVAWLKSADKNLKSLLSYIKDAIVNFVFDLKNQVVNVADTAITVIATSIVGPVIGMVKKAWMFIKQGWSSLKQSIGYIRSPENKGKPISILMMEVGKIITAGLTAVGAIALGEVIEKGLMTVPIFAIEIPLFGSMANIIGSFMGAVVSGIIGALALNLLNRLIEKKQKAELDRDKIDKGNEILATQEAIIAVSEQKLEATREETVRSIKERHAAASKIMRASLEKIMSNNGESNEEEFRQMNRRLDVLQDNGGNA